MTQAVRHRISHLRTKKEYRFALVAASSSLRTLAGFFCACRQYTDAHSISAMATLRTSGIFRSTLRGDQLSVCPCDNDHDDRERIQHRISLGKTFEAGVKVLCVRRQAETKSVGRDDGGTQNHINDSADRAKGRGQLKYAAGKAVRPNRLMLDQGDRVGREGSWHQEERSYIRCLRTAPMFRKSSN